MRHSTSFGAAGIDVVECRRDPSSVDSCREDDFREVATEAVAVGTSAIDRSFDEVVLLRFNDGRTYACGLLFAGSGSTPTCEMLSAGVSSDSSTVERLCRCGFTEFLDGRRSDLMRSRSPFEGGAALEADSDDGRGPYT